MRRFDLPHSHLDPAYAHAHVDVRTSHFGMFHDRRVPRNDQMVNWYRRAPKKPSN